MPNETNVFLSFEVEQSLVAVGQLLREARLVRRDSEEDMAQRLNVSRATWRRIESGDPNVRIGTVLQALVHFGMKERVTNLSMADHLTLALLRRELPKRVRRRNGGSADKIPSRKSVQTKRSRYRVFNEACYVV